MRGTRAQEINSRQTGLPRGKPETISRINAWPAQGQRLFSAARPITIAVATDRHSADAGVCLGDLARMRPLSDKQSAEPRWC